MADEDEFAELEKRVRETVESKAAPLQSAGRIDVRHSVGGNEDHVLTPRDPAAAAVEVAIQTDSELSLFITAPATDRTITVDIFDRDMGSLIDRLGRYLDAVLQGRLELTLGKGSSHGRCRLWLDEGDEQTHYYNVMLGFLVGRGRGWETFRPGPY